MSLNHGGSYSLYFPEQARQGLRERLQELWQADELLVERKKKKRKKHRWHKGPLLQTVDILSKWWHEPAWIE